jgi:hypothetical protein
MHNVYSPSIRHVALESCKVRKGILYADVAEPSRLSGDVTCDQKWPSSDDS